MTASASFPVDVAVEAAFTGDPGLMDLLNPGIPTVDQEPKVFNGKAPQSTPEPYITLAGAAEDAFHVFNRKGNENDLTIDIWTDGSDGFRSVKQIYAAMKRIVDGELLPLDGHTMVRGRLTLITTLNDPSGSAHGIAAYNVLSQVAA